MEADGTWTKRIQKKNLSRLSEIDILGHSYLTDVCLIVSDQFGFN